MQWLKLITRRETNIVYGILVATVISTASFCCTKKFKKLHLFSTRVAKKLHLCANIKNDSDLRKRFVSI